MRRLFVFLAMAALAAGVAIPAAADSGGTHHPHRSIAAARPVPKGAWSELEIRVIGQTYRVYRDGVLINEYENVPGVYMAGRPNDPPSDARGPVGYIGLQAHGAPNDVVLFRNVRIKDLSNRD